MDEASQNAFKEHLSRFISINDAEFEAVSTFFKQLTVKEKENLLEEGQSCKQQFFVLSGCLRMFFINDKGVEQTTQFAIENWWITDHLAFERGLPSNFYVQAVEQTTVLVLTAANTEAI